MQITPAAIEPGNAARGTGTGRPPMRGIHAREHAAPRQDQADGEHARGDGARAEHEAGGEHGGREVAPCIGPKSGHGVSQLTRATGVGQRAERSEDREDAPMAHEPGTRSADRLMPSRTAVTANVAHDERVDDDHGG